MALALELVPDLACAVEAAPDVAVGVDPHDLGQQLRIPDRPLDSARVLLA
jgi:hypothetical protein